MKKYIPQGLRKLVFHNITLPLKRMSFMIKFNKSVKARRCLNNKIAFIMATPEHGNLGDHAIVMSENLMLSNAGYGDSIIEISNQDYLYNKDFILSKVNEDDLIVIDGGGNLGTLWPHEDDKISSIISCFRNNPIIIFPQTCYYSDTYEAIKRLSNNKKMYSIAKNLTLTLRDKKSYNFCNNNFTPAIKLLLVPDIVLSLSNSLDIPNHDRSGVLLCFRDDHERVLNTRSFSELSNLLKSKEIPFTETTTVLSYPVSKHSRSSILQSKFEEFSKAKLIITDRLHAMIFASITNTPCLAFDNLSKKVSGVFEVSGKLEGIEICSSIEDVKDLFDKYYSLSIDRNTFNIDKYNELISIIKKNI